MKLDFVAGRFSEIPFMCRGILPFKADRVFPLIFLNNSKEERYFEEKIKGETEDIEVQEFTVRRYLVRSLFAA